MEPFTVMLSAAKRVRPAIIAIAGLLGLDGALIALTWLVATAPPPSVAAVAQGSWTPPDLDPPVAATAEGLSPEQNDPVLQRPIFFASRRPFEPPPAEVAATPPAPPKPPPADPSFVVDGILLSGSSRRAHLRQPHELDGRWHEAGQVIDGWRIVAIDATGIVLEQEDKSFPMYLYASDASAVPTVGQSAQRLAQ
jgi:hypothetical protein